MPGRAEGRRVGVVAATLALTVASVGLAAAPAVATDFDEVSNETELRAAIDALNLDLGSEHIITLDADFTVTDAVADPIEYTGVGDLLIDGEGYVVTSDGAGGRFLTIQAEVTVVLQDLTITGFTGDPSSWSNHGGAVLALDMEALIIDGVTFEDNSASVAGSAPESDSFFASGGAIVATDTDEVEIYDSRFTGNHADATYTSTLEDSEAEAMGGAVLVYNGDLYLEGVTFSDNYANAIGNAFLGEALASSCGGAVCVDGGSIEAYDVALDSNTAYASAYAGSTDQGNAQAFGGGLASIGGEVFVDESVIEENEANAWATSTGGPGVAQGSGGGLYAGGGTDSEVYQAEFIDNTAFASANGLGGTNARGSGGALASSSTDLSVSGDSLFDGNRARGFTEQGAGSGFSSASAEGGALWVESVIVGDLLDGTVITFSDNLAESTASGGEPGASAEGGAIRANEELVVVFTEFARNSASPYAYGGSEADAVGEGGALWQGGGFDYLYVAASSFEENQVNASVDDADGEGFARAYGGDMVARGEAALAAVSSFGAEALAAASQSEDVLAYAGGGSIASFSSGLDVLTVSSTISDAQARGFTSDGTGVNESYVTGGAIYNDDGLVDVYNSTLVDNEAVPSTDTTGTPSHAARGGAVHGHEVWLTLTTATGNSADEGAHAYSDVDLITEQSIFADPVGGAGCSGVVTSSGYTFDDDGSCSDSDLPANGDYGLGLDPQLEALADNGGYGLTRNPAEGSPVVDAVPELECADEEDQRFVERPLGAGCDSGAVERLADLPFTVDTPGGTILGVIEGGICMTDDELEAVDASTLSPLPPAGVSLPLGVFEFSVCVPDLGWTITVSLTLPQPQPELWKFTGSEWLRVDDAVVSGTTITYEVTDGGPLDSDGVEDGSITDPVGAGSSAGFTG